MTEPDERKPEYKLDDGDFELIRLVEFRLNNTLGRLMNALEPDVANSAELAPKILQALQIFLWERCQAMEQNLDKFRKSNNPDMKKLANAFSEIIPQLMAITGVIAGYLRNMGKEWSYEAVRNAYGRIEPYISEVGNNPAYQAYQARIKRDNLEASRTHFEYEVSSSGE